MNYCQDILVFYYYIHPQSIIRVFPLSAFVMAPTKGSRLYCVTRCVHKKYTSF